MKVQKLCPCDKKMMLPQDAGKVCPYCGKEIMAEAGNSGSSYGFFGSKKNFIIFIIADCVFTLIVVGVILYFSFFKS